MTSLARNEPRSPEHPGTTNGSSEPAAAKDAAGRSGASAISNGSFDDWATPQWLVDACARVWGPFDLDPCCSHETAKAPCYRTKEDNGLGDPWAHERAWINPPYGRGEIERWISKAIKETGACNVDSALMLLPAKTDTSWFHSLVWPSATQIVFLEKRVRFERDGKPGGSPSFGSMLVWFDGQRKGNPGVYRWDPRKEAKPWAKETVKT